MAKFFEFFEANKNLGFWIIGLVSLFILFRIFLPSFYIVNAGERVIIFNSFTGLSDKIEREGFHFKNPWFDKALFYNIRDTGYDIETTASSKDLQNVHVKLRFIYAPVEKALTNIHRELGQNYADIVFPSISKEVLKAVIAKYTAEQVITKREEVSSFIKEDIIGRALKYGIKVRDVAFADVEFSKAYADAIEQKQVAEQQLEASRKQAEAAMVRAKGEAESARIINEASSASENFIELRKIEAQKEIAKTLATSQNVIYLPANSVMMLNPTNKK
jgi:prohibitin 1